MYISQDPIRLSGGHNLYGYVKNCNNWVDPLGLNAEECPVTNSAGDEVTRKLVGNEDELLAEAEKAAGGSLDGWTEEKPNWYMNPDRTRKIEINFEGHVNTNEGPHVTVRDWDGQRYSCTDKIFIRNHEKYKYEYKYEE